MRKINATINPTVSGKADGRAALSAETQRKVVQAAIEVFGQLGYEAASTRALMERAGANLAAIPYHFGGKHGLYLAAAQSIADYARKRFEPIILRLGDAGRADPVTRIDEALADFILLLIGGSEPKEWVSFFVRCEHDADAAFRIIQDATMTPFSRALAETVAAATGGDAAGEDLQMRIAMVLTSMLNLRTMRNMLLSSLGWDALNEKRLERLSTEIRRIALFALLPGATGAGGGI